MSRVLVTGATGLIGRNALAPLIRAGHEVHAVSRSPWPVPDVHWHEADLLADASSVVEDVEPELLLHLAWYVEHGRFWSSPENLRWVRASLELFEAFARVGGQRAVVAGTCAEYDWRALEGPCIEEVTPIKPTTLYGISKHGLHVMAEAWSRQTAIELAWGRIFFLYGAHESPNRLVPYVARSILAGERAATGSGEQIRDFMDVRDVAAGFATVLGSSVTGAVNIASGDGHRMREIIETVARLAGGPELLELGAKGTNASEPEILVADVTRLRDEVGFRPAITLNDGLADAVEYWRLDS